MDYGVAAVDRTTHGNSSPRPVPALRSVAAGWEKFGHLQPAAAEDHPRDGLLNAAVAAVVFVVAAGFYLLSPIAIRPPRRTVFRRRRAVVFISFSFRVLCARTHSSRLSKGPTAQCVVSRRAASSK